MAVVIALLAATAAFAQGAPTTVTAPRFTNDTTPTFEWSGATEPNPSSGIREYTVEIWKSDDSAKVRGPYTVPHGTDPHTWTLPDAHAFGGSGEDDGEYHIRVWTCDAAGNASAGFGSCTFLLDTQAPVLSNGRPTGWGGSVQPILADFTDDCSGLDKSRTEPKQAHNGVSWDVDMRYLGGLPTYNDGDKHITIGKLMTGWYCDGEWTFTMIAYDRAGNKSNELVWKLNVDATPPTAPGEPVAGKVRDDGKWYINTLRPTFRWAASSDPKAPYDHSPGSGLRDYWFQFGSGKPDDQTDDWVSALVNQAGILPTPAVETQQLTPSADLPLVAGVEYSARVKAYDNLGNCSTWVDPLIIYDPNPPTLPGTPITTTPTTDKTPVWKWAGSTDAISGIDLYHIQIRREGSAAWDVVDTFLDIPDTLTPGEQVWEQALQLEDGKYEIRVQAVDVAGNYSAWSGIGAVEIDATPPGAPAIGALNPGYSISSVTLKWNPVEDGDNVITYVLQWARDAGFSVAHDVTVVPQAEQAPKLMFSFTEAGRGEGEYWFRVKTISTVNGTTAPPQTKESEWSAAVSTIYDKTGPAAPVLTLRSANPTNQPTQEWTWSRPVDAVNYDLYWSNTDDAPGPLAAPSAAGVGNIDLYRMSFTNPGEEKTYYVWVRGVDALGNKGLWSEGVPTPSVTVDMKAPPAPENVQLVSDHIVDAEGALYTADAMPKVKWAASDGATYYDIWLDGKYWLSTENTEYEFTEGLANGDHTVKAASVDALGNWEGYSSGLAFVVDTTPPEAPGMPRTESPTADRRPTWTWNAPEGTVAYRVFLDGVAQPAGAESDPNGIPQSGTAFTPAADLADGWHDLQVTAIDALGNESAKSAAGSVLVDGTAPAVPDIAHLPTHTKATQVVFRWSSIGDVAGYDFSYSLGDGDTWTTLEGITTQSYVIKDLDDGVSAKGKVRAYDSLRNTSGWSDIVSTTIDLAGPAVSITAPDAAKNTNLSASTWTWTGNDGERGSGVQGYWVKLNDGAWSWTTEPVLTLSRLRRGANILSVKGVDNLGNEGAVSMAPEVTVVDVAIFDVMPAPGQHPINEASTIAFSVVGLHDGQVEVLLSSKPMEDAWRLVTIVNTPGLAKFYVLLDNAVMQPGPLTVTIKIGDVTRYCDYEVLDERSGFGFGRLRLW